MVGVVPATAVRIEVVPIFVVNALNSVKYMRSTQGDRFIVALRTVKVKS